MHSPRRLIFVAALVSVVVERSIALRHHAAHPRRRILLVEDDAELSEAITDVLDDRGHVVMSAVDGADGLRRMREFRPDIVVLDLMMPRFDGWQFRVEQRRDPAIASTPVVVVSASSSATATAVDADLYLHKPIDAETLIDAVEGVLVSRERRVELAIRAQTARLASIGTLAAGLAHEINNPLTYVMLQLARAQKLLATSERDPIAAEAAAMIRSATEGAERIRDVTSAIRMFTDGETASSTRFAPIDVRASIAAAMKLAATTTRDRARVTSRFSGSCSVIAHEGQLAQVIFQLMMNAAHAIVAGARDDNEIAVAVRDRDGRVVIEVSDTGTGIPDSLVGRVFEPFFTTKPIGDGTGLGLSISHGLVASFGGSIEVSSTLGKGSTFRVVLPGAIDMERSEPPWIQTSRS